MFIITHDDDCDGTPNAVALTDLHESEDGIWITGGVHYSCGDAFERATRFTTYEAAAKFMAPIFADKERYLRDLWKVVDEDEINFPLYVRTGDVSAYDRAMNII